VRGKRRNRRIIDVSEEPEVSMRPKDLTIGMPVWVSKDYKEPDLRGHVGKIERRYGGVGYAAFEVRFWDGRSKLFWHHELKEAYQRTR
jgi:hypothetical protein